jgi:hypothetical protein
MSDGHGLVGGFDHPIAGLHAKGSILLIRDAMLTTQAIESYITGCAGRAGVSVVWDERGSVPRTDGHTMWLPALDGSSTMESTEEVRYFVKHETSHILHTDFEYFQKEKTKGILHFICNCIEDNRIDYLNDNEYRGDAALSRKFYTSLINKMASATGESSAQRDLILPLLMWDSGHRDWIPSMPLFVPAIMPVTTSDVIERYKKLSAGNYGERMEALRTSKEGGTVDLLALAKDILKDIYGADADKYMEKATSKSKKKEEKKEEDEGEGETEGEGGGECKEDGGEGTSPLSDDGDRIIEVDKMAAILGMDHLEPSRTGVKYVGEHFTGEEKWSIVPLNKYVVKREFKGGSNHHFDKIRVAKNIEDNTRPLANKLRHALQVKARGRYEYGVKNGKLHGNSLHKLISSSHSEAASRVFKRHIVSDVLDTAITLLVDCSGSMSGTKFETACASAAAVAGALKPLHIPYSILGFTNDLGSEQLPMINVFNAWGEVVTQPELIRRFDMASLSLWDNSDGDAIAWASNYLTSRKEKRKLLIVLSDGCPQGRDIAGDIRWYTKRVVNEIETRKLHEIYGIGIKDTNVQKYYKNNVVVYDIADLSKSILSIISKVV